MKNIKTIYKWILISVILQTAFLSWLNYVYLPNRGHFKSTMYEAEFLAVKNRSYRLPEGADDISVSYDGLYAAYMLDGQIVIADLDGGREIKRLGPAGGKITYHRWLPDREMLIYAIKEPEGRSGRVRISTHDVIPDLDRSYPDIKGLPEGSAVIDIELSPMTNIVYPKIQTSKTRARIYRFDIMDNLSLMFKTDLTTVVKETLYSDNLVYQVAGERTRVRNGKTGKTSYIPVKQAHLLLDIDGRDVIYAGITDKSGSVSEIRYGKAGTEAAEWNSISLSDPAAADDIMITADGSVYIADRQARTVECVKGGEGRKGQTDGSSEKQSGSVGQDGSTGQRNGLSDFKNGLSDWLDGMKEQLNGSKRQNRSSGRNSRSSGQNNISTGQHDVSSGQNGNASGQNVPASARQGVTAAQDRKLIRYEGRLITMLDQYIVYLDGENLVLRTLEK
ncbi:MAG TPA: hypothetical protein PK767_09715 [Clostridiales bacterium]|nr:hypothetical protein [Clostridiales bacterium]HPP36504.1 hypothetical protein [Clostridiales bacterium]